MQIIATSNSGMETATKLELKKLGIDAPCINGGFTFDGDIKDVIGCNYLLRTAERVFIKLKEFKAVTFDELFDGIVEMNWCDYITKTDKIIVDAKSVKSTIFALSAIQRICKKAIITSLEKKFNSLPETGNEFKILISILNDNVSVLLDTSGIALHRRGYRDMVWKAPIKETIAAGMIILSVWNKDRILVDPFCGSGTIPIEACMIAKNIPSGFYRSFLFEKYHFIDKSYFLTLKKECKDAIDYDFKPKIIGYDIESKAIALANHHKERAELGNSIEFINKDMREFCSNEKFGVIITNPPYGERLLTETEIIELYGDFGKMYSKLPSWCMYCVTSYDKFEKAFGKKADLNRKFFNADIQGRMYGYLSQERPPKKERKE